MVHFMCGPGQVISPRFQSQYSQWRCKGYLDTLSNFPLFNKTQAPIPQALIHQTWMQVADGSHLSPSLRISSIEESHFTQDHVLSQMLTGQYKSIKDWSLYLSLGQLCRTISLPNSSMFPGTLVQDFVMTSFCVQSHFIQFLYSCWSREHFLTRFLYTNVCIKVS